MLNILLSFAQFERENTSEKTRDKMKQRAKLGKWHGGWIPFEYDYNQETKKLIVNDHRHTGCVIIEIQITAYFQAESVFLL